MGFERAESDKGSLYKQEKWLEDYASDQKSKEFAPVSASRPLHDI